MPELPEVESARAVIEAYALHRAIEAVDDTDTYECRPHEPGEIASALVGRQLSAAHRRGKTMWCTTSRGGPDLGIHLGMSGRIVIEDQEGGDPQRGTARKEEWYRFSLTFEGGSRLRLLDKRRLGRVRLDPDLSDLGPDAAEVDREDFRSLVGRGTAPLKARLLDQSTLAGIGNLLADEVLWQSRLDPRRPAGSLSADELDGLRRRLRSSIRSAVRHGGVHTGEVVPHRARDGHCPRCGAEMARGTVGGRTTYWCPVEQA
ncbi:DNA-formamidopyrimidine glycosylase family protein [Marmoricola endophyticus]|uniref:DNA-formamidopyrimidine glycosylase family protein n=1 Tax=Marmoricola endophyticus TaxID=2040280 RepID=UPI00166C1D97|nr:DNA-formamidopyrimidine glycosylase family protein [Marmoricola endophyticus]